MKLSTFFLSKNIRNVLRNKVQKFIHTPVKLSFLNRKKAPKNSPRVCDIDIIDFKGLIIKKRNSFNLSIPHKLAHKRAFVLFPLAEINSNWKHPKFLINIKEMINNLEVNTSNYVKKI